MRSVLNAILIAIVAGGLIGWLAASGGGSGARIAQAPWDLPTPPRSTDGDDERLYEQLMATNHFGEANGGLASAFAVESNADSAPPRIAATTLKDGKIAVSAYGPGDQIVTAGIGETLPGGWVIKEASLDSVAIARDDQNLEIIVFPRDEADS